MYFELKTELKVYQKFFPLTAESCQFLQEFLELTSWFFELLTAFSFGILQDLIVCIKKMIASYNIQLKTLLNNGLRHT